MSSDLTEDNFFKYFGLFQISQITQQYYIFFNFRTKMLSISTSSSMQSLHITPNRYIIVAQINLLVFFCFHGFKNKKFQNVGIAYKLPDFCDFTKKELELLNKC